MAVDQNILKQGYLNKWRNNAENKAHGWHRQYFVLHGASEKNAARLDWYEDENQYHKNPGQRKALFVEEIKKCEKMDVTTPDAQKVYGSAAKYVFVIYTYRTSITNYVLRCETEAVLADWVEELNKLLKYVNTLTRAIRTTVLNKGLDQDDIYNPIAYAASSYDVQIDDTAAAIQCELLGEYRLLLSQQHITLVDPDTSNPVITWMYRHIRRFGFSENSFTIEGGSKCGLGTGLFIFKTGHGNQLMEAIKERMQFCKNQQSSDEEYSYISLSKMSLAEASGTADGKATDKKAKQAKSNTNSLEKPSPPKKPKPQVALSQPTDSKPTRSATTTSQPKISEVLQILSKQNPTAANQNNNNTEEPVYGYNQLDLKMEAGPPKTAVVEENPYGEQLIQKLKDSQ